LSTGARVFAVQNVLNEIKNISPEVSNTFLFAINGEILAKDDDTSLLSAGPAAKAFNILDEKAKSIGRLESVTFCGSHQRMNISRLNDSYLATIASKESSPRRAETLTRVLVPAILRLVDNLQLVTEQEPTIELNEPEPSALDTPADETQEAAETDEDSQTNNVDKSEPAEPNLDAEQHESELQYEPSPEEPPATQFIIEHLGGLLVAPDTVRVDSAAIMQWKELYGDKEINEVEVETLSGVKTRCKFKPIKDSKLEGKGVIQMPQKMQLALQTSQGELVMVKPVVE